jgi:hypothetical protein
LILSVVDILMVTKFSGNQTVEDNSTITLFPEIVPLPPYISLPLLLKKGCYIFIPKLNAFITTRQDGDRAQLPHSQTIPHHPHEPDPPVQIEHLDGGAAEPANSAQPAAQPELQLLHIAAEGAAFVQEEGTNGKPIKDERMLPRQLGWHRADVTVELSTIQPGGNGFIRPRDERGGPDQDREQRQVV